MSTDRLPFKVAVLCYLYDEAGRLLLLHRVKDPNRGMYSPIGGKLEVHEGEAPHDCARREIREEAGLDVPVDLLHLTGLVSERAYEGETHWLIFLYEVRRVIDPAEITEVVIDEGRLEWIPAEEVADCAIPETDRTILWPLVRRHRGGFFAVHIDCRDGGMAWTLNESRPAG
jgi:8-oxo-dGTP diphosphatase